MRSACGRVLMAGLALCLACVAAQAQEGDPEGSASEPPEKPLLSTGPVEMKATEVAVRFTPKMAQAISKRFAEQMKGRYDLDDGQVKAVDRIISEQFIKLATENARSGRDLIENLIETVIEHGGNFPRENAQEFGKLAKAAMPALKGFFADSARRIGKEMGLKQRLEFTGDMAMATAGLIAFEARMSRWEEGKVGKFSNPFRNLGKEAEEAVGPEPEDPDEPDEHLRARMDAERWMEWRIDIDKRWDSYVGLAIEFYAFDEPQITSANAILKDCHERAEQIKTPRWREAIKENRIAQQLSWRMGPKYRLGPWMFKLESEYEKLRKPLVDLQDELKRRIDSLPDSEQRAASREGVRKALAEKGVKRLPA